MARKKPQSAKQRKAQLQEKRAIKRGDLPTPSPALRSNTTRGSRSAAGGLGYTLHAGGTAAGRVKESDPSSKRLASKFIDLPPEFIQRARTTALTEVMPRPIDPEVAVFPVELVERARDKPALRIMRRPKWRYDQTKKEVEKNEEGMFAKWLAAVDSEVDEWREEGLLETKARQEQAEAEKREGGHKEETKKIPGISWPRSATFFERNLQVYRQLWRTIERSSILLVLIDVRCPPLHFPPSLQEYISSLTPRREIVLLLTKNDLVPEDISKGWLEWCTREWGHFGEVVPVESYRREARKQGTRAAIKSHLPSEDLMRLIDALERAHKRLLTPPAPVAADPGRLARWKPWVKEDVDWAGLRQYKAPPVGGRAQAVGTEAGEEGETGEEEKSDDEPEREEDEEKERGGEGDEGQADAAGVHKEEDFLTIGLIGQPNVGKSSLLNALLGQSRVRASKTPGKTKHFQTIFWSPSVRLADTPGLVLPSLTPYELQAVSSILPISQVPALPAVLGLAGRLIPLEQVLGLKHDVEGDAAVAEGVEAKKTWRAGMSNKGGKREEIWTTGDILEGWALERGFLTAKAGRPDLMRAANHILRSIAEARINWAFSAPPLPPASFPSEEANTSPPVSIAPLRPGQGIWLGEREKITYESSEEEENESEPESEWAEEDGFEAGADSEEGGLEGHEESEESEEDDTRPTMVASSMFSSLIIEGEEDQESRMTQSSDA